ncbi:SMAD/FHA domain-containing protein [Chlamydoabsidia padenii]|nr:SMAD/FHA domain-containing protein [Chlamydoabsidia padenii]
MEETEPVHLRIVPHLGNTRSMVFGVIERDVTDGILLKIGRFTDKYASPTRIAFKSKVVSRGHAEMWTNNGKFYIRDTKSSSGTFLNHVRLSPPNQESRPFLLTDGDVIQLGVDYQGGNEEVYRCVRMRLEINRPAQNRTTFSLNTFQSLRNMTTPPNNVSILDSAMGCNNTNTSGITNNNNDNDIHVEECCICLYALAPFQCLFVAPCSHTFHYKCVTPLLVNHPGFNCPLCRSYADLDASVAVEASEVMEMYKREKQQAKAVLASTSIGMAAASLVDTRTDDSIIEDSSRPTDSSCIPSPTHPSPS